MKCYSGTAKLVGVDGAQGLESTRHVQFAVSTASEPRHITTNSGASMARESYSRRAPVVEVHRTRR